MALAPEAPATSITAEGPTSHTQNQGEGLAKLRIPFPAEQISPLPKIICGECSRSRTKVCENPRHSKSKCKDCGNYITQAHMHLDYVGHAELTNRLLEADPLWDWEPLALDQRGLPQFDSDGGLWIRLTVCGHTRLGYGDAQGKSGPNAVKEAIGDALRNAAMRFGAALDLWARSDLNAAQSEHPKSAEDEGRASPTGGQPAPEHSRADPQPASKASADDDPLGRLVAQYQDPAVWGNKVALLQIRLDGKKHGVSDRSVQDPDGSWTTFDALLESRIAQLKAPQGDAEKSAA
jgi:hypothetical protein